MHKLRRLKPIFIAAVVVLALGAGSCEEISGSKADNDATNRTKTVEQLINGQPAQSMTYSPTRETINGWINTWSKPGKLSFVYMTAANGQLTGYYVLKGLPVSYCASVTRNYDVKEADLGDYNGDMMVPAPGVDGVWYSGGQCNQYYGFDATTGTYIEFSIGASRDYILSEEPLPNQEAAPLSVTTAEAVAKNRTPDGDYIISP